MPIDIEFEVVPLDDSGERGELVQCSVNEREGDCEVHVATTQPPRVDRPLKPSGDDFVEDLERLSEPHSAYNARTGLRVLRSVSPFHLVQPTVAMSDQEGARKDRDQDGGG